MNFSRANYKQKNLKYNILTTQKKLKNKMPDWCNIDPIVDSLKSQILKKSWNSLVNGTAQGLREISLSTHSSDSKSKSTSDNNNLQLKSPNVKERRLSPSQKNRNLIKKKPLVVLFDILYQVLSSKFPRLTLKLPGSTRARAKMFAAAFGFIVQYSANIANKEFEDIARSHCYRHNNRGITDSDYDSYGYAMILALQKCLGNDFDSQTKEAWVDVYSLLLIRILQYTEVVNERYVECIYDKSKMSKVEAKYTKGPVVIVKDSKNCNCNIM